MPKMLQPIAIAFVVLSIAWVLPFGTTLAHATTPDFLVSANPMDVTIPVGGSATFTLNLVSIGGLTGTAGFQRVGSIGLVELCCRMPPQDLLLTPDSPVSFNWTAYCVLPTSPLSPPGQGVPSPSGPFTFSFTLVVFNAATAIYHDFTVTGHCVAPHISVSKFFTDTSLNLLPLDRKGNPMVNVTLSHGKVVSTNPGQIMAWVNVTNTSGLSLQSLKLNETLPVDWTVDPAWMPAKGAIHVFYANTTSLATNPDITQPSTITVSTGNPQVVHLAVSNFNATAIGHPLMPGQSILLSVKLSYGLIGTSQSATSYPINYTDVAMVTAWSQVSYSGTQFTGSGSAFFTADAKVVS